MPPKARWVPDFKGGPGQTSFEITVLREDNKHGIASYGWTGLEKLHISHSGGPCRDVVTPRVWDLLCGVAYQLANELNAKESG